MCQFRFSGKYIFPTFASQISVFEQQKIANSPFPISILFCFQFQILVLFIIFGKSLIALRK